MKKSNTGISRKQFLKRFGGGLAGLSFLATFKFPGKLFAKDKTVLPRVPKKHNLNKNLSVVKGEKPGALAREAVNMLGGMDKLVSKGDIVVVKPNMGWSLGPEYAVNTNPEVMAELVKMCYEAGAKKVHVFDRSCTDEYDAYKNSGIKAACAKEKAKVKYFDEYKCVDVKLEDGLELKSWPVYKDVLEADVVINVPVAKHHSLAGLTLSLKNMMGVIGGDRGKIHKHFDKKITDINRMVRPELTVIDAYRILLRHGPRGGKLKDVELKKTLIASTDPVAADAYAATLFGKKPEDLKFINTASAAGLGEADLAKVKIVEKNI